jgi:branched-chain amino acid transport system ATP-binding protein
VAAILELEGVCAHYGRIQALRDVSLHVAEGEIVTIIGANGAGKSTTLMTICGIVRASAGEVRYQGASILDKRADELPALGLCQVPEGRRIFPRLTVQENLDMGAFLRRDADEIEADLGLVFRLFPVLFERRKQHGGTLSGGEQQMLAIARAFMGRPKMLLLDEPSLGLSPMISQHIFRIIRNVNEERGVTILLVEQNANMALKLADRAYVMETGSVVMEDKASALRENTDIKKAYLGQ